MVLALSKLGAGPRPKGYDDITSPIGLASRVSNVTKNAKELTHDKEILENSGGNNNEIIIATTYDRASLDNTTCFDYDGDSVVRNEDDTTYIKKTLLNKATGKTRVERELYKKTK